jgi:hypothetical protein
MTKVAHTGSVEEKMTVVVWLFTAQPKNSRWYCERYHRNCYSMVVQANEQVNEGSK